MGNILSAGPQNVGGVMCYGSIYLDWKEGSSQFFLMPKIGLKTATAEGQLLMFCHSDNIWAASSSFVTKWEIKQFPHKIRNVECFL